MLQACEANEIVGEKHLQEVVRVKRLLSIVQFVGRVVPGLEPALDVPVQAGNRVLHLVPAYIVSSVAVAVDREGLPELSTHQVEREVARVESEGLLDLRPGERGVRCLPSFSTQVWPRTRCLGNGERIRCSPRPAEAKGARLRFRSK